MRRCSSVETRSRRDTSRGFSPLPSRMTGVADAVGTSGHDMIHSGELAKMGDFRNHLVHGVISVHP